MPEEIDEEKYEDLVESGETWVLDFWAEWCGPCRQMKPVFESVSEEVEGANFGKIDIEEHQKLAVKNQVRSIPTFLVLKGGEEVARQMGAMSESDFREWVESSI